MVLIFRTLCAKPASIQWASSPAQRGEQEAAAIPQLRVAPAELVAGVAQRQWLARLPGTGMKRHIWSDQAVSDRVSRPARAAQRWSW